MNALEIARVAHQANRELQRTQAWQPYTGNGVGVAPPWDKARQELRDSVLDGVRHALAHPELTPEQSHENWLRFKQADGWVYGPVKSDDRKIHPCLLPYDQLPEDQKVKDRLFLAIVRALA